MLEAELSKHLKDKDITWHLKEGGHVSPSETDVLDALDEAARVLYALEGQHELEVGGLIIQQTTDGFDVFAYFGSYT